MFEIIDHRKNKSLPQWASAYLMRVRCYLKPTNMFGKIEHPTMDNIHNATKSILSELERSAAKRWQGISPSVKYDSENKTIQIFNSHNILLIEIKEGTDNIL